MSQYGLAEDTMRSAGPDVSPNDLYSQSAIYVAAAHALKPNYSVCVFPLFDYSAFKFPYWDALEGRDVKTKQEEFHSQSVIVFFLLN
jgi:hypothetical protein